MRVVCAGGGQKAYMQACVDYDCSKLYSMLVEGRYILKWDPKKWLMIDSGAHSWNKFSITKIGHQSAGKLPDMGVYLKKYAEFMNANKKDDWFWVEFDVYGHLKKEEIDAQYAHFSSIVGRDRFIRVYHPVIDRGSLKELERWIAEGQTYIGVGNDSVPLLDQIFARTRDKVKIHGFAMTKYDLLTKYPFYSVDSTSPLSAFMYGSIPQENLRKSSKKSMASKKDPRFFRDTEKHMINGIIELKKTEAYLTELWKRRGVIWHD